MAHDAAQWRGAGAPLGVNGKRGNLQNRHGDEASTYRGRVLRSMQVVTRPKTSVKRVAHVKTFSFKPTAGLKPARGPPKAGKFRAPLPEGRSRGRDVAL